MWLLGMLRLGVGMVTGGVTKWLGCHGDWSGGKPSHRTKCALCGRPETSSFVSVTPSGRRSHDRFPPNRQSTGREGGAVVAQRTKNPFQASAFLYLFSIWKRQLEPVVLEREARQPLSLPSLLRYSRVKRRRRKSRRVGERLKGVSNGSRKRNFYIPALLLIVSWNLDQNSRGPDGLFPCVHQALLSAQSASFLSDWQLMSAVLVFVL